MNSDHKKILRAVSLELRYILEGQYDDQGRFQPGDLERRLNEIGLWRDRPTKAVAELPHLSPEDRQARQVVDTYLNFLDKVSWASVSELTKARFNQTWLADV